ncbi:hypothetical protein AAIB33_11325 [Microbacterium sp. AZCO]
MTLARGLTAMRLAVALRTVKAANLMGEATGLRVWNAEARTITTLR